MRVEPVIISLGRYPVLTRTGSKPLRLNVIYLVTSPWGASVGTEWRTCPYSLSFVPLYAKMILNRGEMLINVKKNVSVVGEMSPFPVWENQ